MVGSYVGRVGLAAAGTLVWLALGLGAVVSASGAAADPNLYPFGEPSGGPAVKVPSPPGAPTLAPTIATKTTTRLYGADPFEEAVSITQHIWPAALPENAPDLVPDRPRAVTLLTPDDPLTAITATPLIHFPDDAPVLYVAKDGIPEVTLNEIKVQARQQRAGAPAGGTGRGADLAPGSMRADLVAVGQDAPGQFEAGDTGQIDVEHADLRALGDEPVKSDLCARRLHDDDVGIVRHQGPAARGHDRMVIDNQNTHLDAPPRRITNTEALYRPG